MLLSRHGPGIVFVMIQKQQDNEEVQAKSGQEQSADAITETAAMAGRPMTLRTVVPPSPQN